MPPPPLQQYNKDVTIDATNYTTSHVIATIRCHCHAIKSQHAINASAAITLLHATNASAAIKTVDTRHTIAVTVNATHSNASH